MITSLRHALQVEPLQAWVREGKPIWGTCAGLILLASETISEDGYMDPTARAGNVKKLPGLLGGLDIVVHRNFFGTQVRSFEKRIAGPPRGESQADDYNGLFIRAPAVIETSKHVTVLAALDSQALGEMDLTAPGEQGVAVAVQQENVLATSFHPELTEDPRWHLYFFDMICQFLDFGSPYVKVEMQTQEEMN